MKYLILPVMFVLLICISCKEDEENPLISDKAPNGHYLQQVGASANELLASENYTTLTIQIAYVAGFEPENQAITQLNSFLQSRVNKPGGIAIRTTEIAPPGRAPYSLRDIQDIEYTYRTSFTSDESLSIFIFIADGNYSSNENVLGLAYQNTSVALFGKKINEISGGIGQPGKALLEATVLNHEFGHLMGLVNVGTLPQTDHQDLANGKHCDVESCLMYWKVETGDIVTNLLGQSEPPSLDSQCIADLQANDGR